MPASAAELRIAVDDAVEAAQLCHDMTDAAGRERHLRDAVVLGRALLAAEKREAATAFARATS